MTLGTLNAIATTDNEPSAVWSSTARPQLVVAYNSFGTSSTNGWAVSTTGLGTFNKCDFNSTGCNAGVVADHPTGTWIWAGDPTLADDGAGHMVYVSLVDTNTSHGGSETVAATVSTNGGTTFGQAAGSTVVVNSDNCIGGTEDQPSAAFDYTTSPATLWVAWRHRGTDIGVYGLCAKRGFINPSTLQIQWLGSTLVVPATGSESFWGIGGVRVQASDNNVTLVFSGTDHQLACPTTQTWGQTWWSITSHNNGANWDTQTNILTTNNFRWCIVNQTIQNSLRAFDFVRAADGTDYVAINDSANTVRVYMNHAGSGQAWREYCQNTVPDGPGLPQQNWTMPGAACAVAAANGTGPSVLQPTLAADAQSRVSLMYYETSDATDAQIQPIYRGHIRPRSGKLGDVWQLGPSPLSTSFVPPPGTPSGGQPLGDYEAMAVQNGAFAPGCGAAGVFWPAWGKVNAASGQMQVETRSSTLQ